MPWPPPPLPAGEFTPPPKAGVAPPPAPKAWLPAEDTALAWASPARGLAAPGAAALDATAACLGDSSCGAAGGSQVMPPPPPREGAASQPLDDADRCRPTPLAGWDEAKPSPKALSSAEAMYSKRPLRKFGSAPGLEDEEASSPALRAGGRCDDLRCLSFDFRRTK
jgi:hypothetical protein